MNFRILAATVIVAAAPLAAFAQAPAGSPGGPMSAGAMPDTPPLDGAPSDGAMPEGARPGMAHWPLARREDWLRERIDRAADHGWLSGNEITRGRAELQAIRSQQESLTNRDGGALSPTDRRYLAQRINELNATLRWQGENPPPPWS